MENLYKVGGSNQRLRQAKNYLWQGLVDQASALFHDFAKKRCDPQPRSGQTHAEHDDGANQGFALEPALQGSQQSWQVVEDDDLDASHPAVRSTVGSFQVAREP